MSAKANISMFVAILAAILDFRDEGLVLAVRNYVRSIRWDLKPICRHQNHTSIHSGSSVMAI